MKFWISFSTAEMQKRGHEIIALLLSPVYVLGSLRTFLLFVRSQERWMEKPLRPVKRRWKP